MGINNVSTCFCHTVAGTELPHKEREAGVEDGESLQNTVPWTPHDTDSCHLPECVRLETVLLFAVQNDLEFSGRWRIADLLRDRKKTIFMLHLLQQLLFYYTVKLVL